VIHADEMATVWVVRGGPRDRLVRAFLDDGEIGVVFPQFPDGHDVDADRAQHRRPVEWRRRLPFASLPARLDHLPDQRSVLEDVPDGRLRDLARQCTELQLGDDPFDRPAVAPPRRRTTSSTGRPRTPRKPAPKRPSQATRAERRCTVCLVTKSEDLFDDAGDVCGDCA